MSDSEYSLFKVGPHPWSVPSAVALWLIDSSDAPANSWILGTLLCHLIHHVQSNLHVLVHLSTCPVRRSEVTLMFLPIFLVSENTAGVFCPILRAWRTMEFRKQLDAILLRIVEDEVNVGLVLTRFYSLNVIIIKKRII